MFLAMGHIFPVNKNGYFWQTTTKKKPTKSPVSSLGELSRCLGGSDYFAGTVTLGACTEQEGSQACGESSRHAASVPIITATSLPVCLIGSMLFLFFHVFPVSRGLYHVVCVCTCNLPLE